MAMAELKSDKEAAIMAARAFKRAGFDSVEIPGQTPGGHSPGRARCAWLLAPQSGCAGGCPRECRNYLPMREGIRK